MSCFRRTDSVPKFSCPLDLAFVTCRPRWGGCPHPFGGILVFAWTPIFPREVSGFTGIIDDKFIFGIDSLFTIGERELEELCFSDGLSWACFYAKVTVDTS